MNSEIEQVIREYYDLLGLEYSKSRVREQVQARAAMMVALKKYKPYSVVGRAFDMDHATVIHHCKNHEGNLATWGGYAEKFDIAKAMCAKTIKYKTVQAKLKSVRHEIKRLQRIEFEMMKRVRKTIKSDKNG